MMSAPEGNFNSFVKQAKLIARATDCSDNNISDQTQKSNKLIRALEASEKLMELALSYLKKVGKNSPNYKEYETKFLDAVTELVNLIPTVKEQLQEIKDLLECEGLRPASERTLRNLKDRLEKELADLEAVAERLPKLKSGKILNSTTLTPLTKVESKLRSIKKITGDAFNQYGKPPIKEAVIWGGTVLGGAAAILDETNKFNKVFNGN